MKFIRAPKNPKECNFWDPKYIKKYFFKKPEFYDLAEHWGWFPRWLGS